jgi:hypothetical protein
MIQIKMIFSIILSKSSHESFKSNSFLCSVFHPEVDSDRIVYLSVSRGTRGAGVRFPVRVLICADTVFRSADEHLLLC